VVDHLDGHLEKLPGQDGRSRAIVEQMKADEARHGEEALQAGGRELPGPVRRLMTLASRVMTKTAYWI
jgi:3-demethoxyubiquinol 3-hydroxylase